MKEFPEAIKKKTGGVKDKEDSLKKENK